MGYLLDGGRNEKKMDKKSVPFISGRLRASSCGEPVLYKILFKSI